MIPCNNPNEAKIDIGLYYISKGLGRLLTAFLAHPFQKKRILSTENAPNQKDELGFADMVAHLIFFSYRLSIVKTPSLF